MLEENLKKLLISRLEPLKAALIVVDVQNDFCHNKGAFSKMNLDLSYIQKILPKLILFIDKWQQFNLPIIFVKTIHSEWTNSPSWLKRIGGMAEKTPICLPDSWGAEFYEIQPKNSDYVVTKHRYSAFVGTDLDLILRSKGIETILLSGVATNVCVETTARDGFNLNYNVILVEDCCGAYVLEEHISTLKNINKYFGVVSDSQGIVEIMRRLRE